MEGPRPGGVGPVVISPWDAKFHYSLNNQSLFPTQTHLFPFSLCASLSTWALLDSSYLSLEGPDPELHFQLNAHISEDGSPH